MRVSINFIHGLKLGAEHIDLDDDERKEFGIRYTSLVVIDLFLLRLSISSGYLSE